MPEAANSETEKEIPKRIPYQKTLAVLSILGLTLTAAGCDSDPPPPADDQAAYSDDGVVMEDDEDDDNLFIYHGGSYYPYRSFTGSWDGATMVSRKNGTYVPYTGAKHPPSWSGNPGYVKPTTSQGTGNVVRKSSGSSSSSSGSIFGSGGSKSSFGSSSSGARGSAGSGSSSSGG
ncbi:hypothetical protein H1S01_03810 [Heliobacterium chlorum]|uniref:Lipoprotein n=1 Tax=Heliobacterium chlorum TaxID=2698 RepID=A0ABR7T125_HELCL|nr:hypothetical protein [Heliobacterium chlorum]MBC9783640.1 hypothetical protein [Heliobacterium chlorum]